MPKLEIRESHHLPLDSAKYKIQKLLTELRKEYSDKISSDITETWNGNQCNFDFYVMGLLVSGTITIQLKEVVIFLDLPFLAGFYKSKIEQSIRQKAKDLLK